MANNISKLTDAQVEEQFTDLVRERMTDREFWDWVAEWYDPESIIDDVEAWDISDKRDTLIEFATRPMFSTLYLTPDELKAVKQGLDRLPVLKGTDSAIKKVNSLVKKL